jgi:hypothetical protein
MQARYDQLAQLGTFRRVSVSSFPDVSPGETVAVFAATNCTPDRLVGYVDDPEAPVDLITITGATLERFPRGTWLEVIGTAQEGNVLQVITLRTIADKPASPLWLRVHHNMHRFNPRTYAYL